MLESILSKALPNLSKAQLGTVSWIVARFIVRHEVLPYKKDLTFLKEEHEQSYLWLVEVLRWRLASGHAFQLLWRAIYFKARHGCHLATAATHFKANEEDVRWVWTHLDDLEKYNISKHCSEQDVFLDPLPKKEFDKICFQLAKHAKVIAGKRLRFLVLYDHALTLEDLSSELVKEGIATVRRYETLSKDNSHDVAFILNKGRCSISTTAIDMLHFFTHPRRARIVNHADSQERDCASCGESMSAGVLKCLQCGSQGFLRQENDYQATTLSMDTLNERKEADGFQSLHNLVGFDSRNYTMEKMFLNFMDSSLAEKYRKLLQILIDEPSDEFEAYLVRNDKDINNLSLEKKRKWACAWLELDLKSTKKHLKKTYKAWEGQKTYASFSKSR